MCALRSLVVLTVLLAAAEGGAQTTASAPPSPGDPPRWWQKYDVAIGPGIAIQQVGGQADLDDLTLDVAAIGRVGGGRGISLGPFRRGPKGRLAPALRINRRATSTQAGDSLSPDAMSFGRVRLRPAMAGVRWFRTLRPRWSSELFGATGVAFTASRPATAHGRRAGDHAP